MAIRYRRRVRLGKGVWINLSKGVPSLSAKVGPFTVNSRGRTTTHLAPGLSYTSTTAHHAGSSSSHQTPAAAAQHAPDALLGGGNSIDSLRVSAKTHHLIDAAFAAGFAAGTASRAAADAVASPSANAAADSTGTAATPADQSPQQTLPTPPTPSLIDLANYEIHGDSPRFRRRALGLHGGLYWTLFAVAFLLIAAIPGAGPWFAILLTIAAIITWVHAPLVGQVAVHRVDGGPPTPPTDSA